jgi:hypothetical protein
MYCVEVLAALAMFDCAAAARISVGKGISEVLSDMNRLLKAPCEQCLRLTIMSCCDSTVWYEQWLCCTSASPAVGSPELASGGPSLSSSAKSATIEYNEVRAWSMLFMVV